MSKVKEITYLVKPLKGAIDDEFDNITRKIIVNKKQEKESNEARVTAETQLIADYFGTLATGSRSIASAQYDVQVTFPTTAEMDGAGLSAAIGEDLMKQITVPDVKFSKSGYNAVVKRLTTESLTNPAAKEELIKLQRALKKFVTFKANKPQVAIEPVV